MSEKAASVEQNEEVPENGQKVIKIDHNDNSIIKDNQERNSSASNEEIKNKIDGQLDYCDGGELHQENVD